MQTSFTKVTHLKSWVTYYDLERDFLVNVRIRKQKKIATISDEGKVAVYKIKENNKSWLVGYELLVSRQYSCSRRPI